MQEALKSENKYYKPYTARKPRQNENINKSLSKGCAAKRGRKRGMASGQNIKQLFKK